MKADDDRVLTRIKALGVNDPANPTSADIMTVLNAWLRNQQLDVRTFSRYVDLIKIPAQKLLEGLSTFSSDQQVITGKAIDVIQRSIDILDKELMQDLPASERAAVRDQILKLTDDARKEAQADRDYRETLAYAGLAAVVIAVGGAIYIFSKGRERSVLLKGVELVKRLKK